MLLVAVAWVYVVLLVALVEATSAQGTVLGALVTVLLYGVLPLGIVAYLFLGPARRRARRAAEATASAPAGLDPDGSDHAPGDGLAAVRKEP